MRTAEVNVDPADEIAEFMNLEWWEPVIEAKRKIKSLQKEIEKHEQIMSKHYVRLTGFFVVEEQEGQ